MDTGANVASHSAANYFIEGINDFTEIASVDERDRVARHFAEVMAKWHAIPAEKFAEIGFFVPTDAEQLKDITKIHTWPSTSELGAHKPPPGAKADVQPGEKQVVLVIRGELLKRYPNTVVYAQKAIKDSKGNEVIRETDLTPDEFDRELKFPMFRAEI